LKEKREQLFANEIKFKIKRGPNKDLF